jgi:hypothetical protein
MQVGQITNRSYGTKNKRALIFYQPNVPTEQNHNYCNNNTSQGKNSPEWGVIRLNLIYDFKYFRTTTIITTMMSMKIAKHIKGQI